MSFDEFSIGATARLQNGLNGLLRREDGSVSSIAVLVIAALPIVLVLMKKLLYPTYDPREPPVLRPRVPFIGHLVSLIKETNSFYIRLYNERKMPICTLPMLAGKMYVINSPTLIGAAMRNQSLSFDPFQLEFSVGALGMTSAMVKRFSADGVLWSINKAIHEALLGDNLLRLMARALKDFSNLMNSVPPTAALEVANSYDWLRLNMGLAAMNGLLGEKNPFREEALDCMWEYDKAIGILAVAPAAGLLAPKGLKARNRLHEMLRPFYVAHYDERPDCSALISLRGRLMRNLGLTSEEICLCEIAMPWASITNTTVALFWLFVHVFSRPDYISRIRDEINAVTKITEEGGHRVATVDAPSLEKKCPFVLASYREVLRLYDDTIGNRRVMEDTTLQDADGREYLLKKGTNVQWTAGVTATHGSCWGDKIKEYDPERWLNPSTEEEKGRRLAFIPFGGGKYLCPGRQFALTEILGFIGALALGFEIKGVQVPPDQNPYMAGAMRQPVLTDVDMSVNIHRREGWEDVEWRFYCAGF